VKVAYVVQRYGDIKAGAEAHCRAFAHRLAARGVAVDVFTTCARDYRTWANELPAGTSSDGHVSVHRFPVVEPRSSAFDTVSNEVLPRPWLVPRERQEEWMRMQGPHSPALIDALGSAARDYDVVAFITYLYYTTYFGLPVVGERAVLHPTAHDEPAIYLSMFDDVFAAPRGLVFLTDEEKAFVHRRFGAAQPSIVAGVGVEPPLDCDPARARDRFGLAGPYVLYLGRIDPLKGMDHLPAFFARFGERTGAAADLVVAGDGNAPPGVRALSEVSEQEKWDLLAGAEVLIHPSYHESFALTLLEAWSVGTPVFVNGASDVLVGHCMRSNGGLWYRSYAEFEAGLGRLLGDDRLRRALGAQGESYVRSTYRWDEIIDRYLGFLETVRPAA